jgi:hypothetical protein
VLSQPPPLVIIAARPSQYQAIFAISSLSRCKHQGIAARRFARTMTRPLADVERPHVRPDEPHLLLARPDDLLALAEGDLQAEAVGDCPQDVGEKPEYLVPQMLLRWIVEERKYDGIRFFSTRVNRFFDASSIVHGRGIADWIVAMGRKR